MTKLKIALLAPLKRPITPQTTVSRNRIVLELAKGLSKRGHTITLFGTGNSQISNLEIVSVVPKGLIELPPSENPFYTDTAYIVHATMKLLSEQKRFDIIHNHMYPEFIPLISSSLFKKPLITTVHSQITPELKMALSDTYGSSILVSISKSAKAALNLNSRLIYNGIDTDFFIPNSILKSYLLFVGRMSKAKENGKFMDPKGVVSAIKVAQKTGDDLRIVGNIEDKSFYDELIAPNLSEKIQLVGEVSSEQNVSREEMLSLYQNAKVLIFPIRWEEPFGLVMAEAMACGIPVIAYNRGSVPEIVRDGLTGFIIDPDDEDRPGKGKWIIKKQGIEGLIEAVKRIGEIDRKACRKHVKENFSDEKMVENYEKLYQEILAKK